MTDNFPRCLAAVLVHEGGWSDHPRDPGGATMKGVTLVAYSDWKGRPMTKDQLKAITDAELGAFYRTRYWNAASCDKLSPGLDYMIFDLAMNSGVGRASKYLQRAAGVPEDGHVGPITLAAVNRIGARQMVFKVQSYRDAFYHGLDTFDAFGDGWMRRLKEVTAQAIAWC